MSHVPTKRFRELLGISPEGYHHLLRLYTAHLQQSPARSPSLCSGDELILILLFLRHYPVDLLLAFALRITKSQVQRVRQRLLPWLYTTLHPHLSLRTQQFRRQNGTTLCSRLFTWIIDGTEQHILSPSNITLNTLFYSAKKDKHTISILLIIAFDGTILYLSPSYPGSHHDRELARRCKHEWYPHLHHSEWGLGDSGFDGLDEEGWNILTPPRERDQTYRTIAHYRIRVEQKIEEVKNFRVCREQLRVPCGMDDKQLLLFHQQVYSIVSVLVNDYR